MSIYDENINNHDCKFEVWGENNQFNGKATIMDPCISQKYFFTPEDKKFTTENAVKEFLRNDVNESLENPFYTHPMVDSSCQVIGTSCISDDRHVLAAAIVSGCDAIVTFNIKDFPDQELNKFSIESQHPDDFLMHLT